MKYLLYTLIFFVPLILNAQDDNSLNIGETFILKAEQRVYEYDLETGVLVKTPAGDKVSQIAKRKSKYRLVSIISSADEQYYVIKFWDYTGTYGAKFVDKNDNDKYFAIRAIDFQITSIKYPKVTEFVFGTSIMPAKLRFKNAHSASSFDFSKDISLGVSFGLRTGINELKPYYFSILADLGITSVSVTPESTRGFIPEIANYSAFSCALGAMFEIKGAQLGIYGGFDFLGKAVSEEWVYQGKPWLAVGVGIGIFQNGIGTGSEPGKNDPQ